MLLDLSQTRTLKIKYLYLFVGWPGTNSEKVCKTSVSSFPYFFLFKQSSIFSFVNFKRNRFSLLARLKKGQNGNNKNKFKSFGVAKFQIEL